MSFATLALFLRWLLVLELNLVDILLLPRTPFCVIINIDVCFILVIVGQDIGKCWVALLSSCWGILLLFCHTIQIYGCNHKSSLLACLPQFLFLCVINGSNVDGVALRIMSGFGWRHSGQRGADLRPGKWWWRLTVEGQRLGCVACDDHDRLLVWLFVRA